MNTAQLVVPEILSPLQGLLRWFVPATSPHQPRPAYASASRHEFAINTIATTACQTRAEPQNHSDLSNRRPLRVVRILEADHVQANVGRMMISGRMADVCAELDRLVAHETAFH